MQIILSVAKCIKSSRVFSKLPSCRWRTNNHWQPLEKRTEPMGPRVCLQPKKAKLESLLELLRGRAWDRERGSLCTGGQGCSLEQEREVFPTFLPSPRSGIQGNSASIKPNCTLSTAALGGSISHQKYNKPNPCLRKKLELFKNKALLVQGATATAK